MQKEIEQSIFNAKKSLESFELELGITSLKRILSKIDKISDTRSFVHNKKSEIYLLLGEAMFLNQKRKCSYHYFFLSTIYRPDHYKPYEKLYVHFPSLFHISSVWLNLNIKLVRLIYTLSKGELFSSYLQRLNITLARLFLKKQDLNQAQKIFDYISTFPHPTIKTKYWLGYYYFSIQNYPLSIAYYKAALVNACNKELVSALMDCYCCSGQLSEAERLLDLYDDSFFSDIVKRKFFLCTGNFKKGWHYTAKTKIHSQLLESNIDYVTDVTFLTTENTLYILAIWGVGDEVRWSIMYKQFLKLIKIRVKIVCDPRLYSLFTRSFPELDFISSPRLFFGNVNHDNIQNYNKLPNYYLSTILNNDLFTDIIENNIKVTTVLDMLKLTNSNIDSFKNCSSLIPNSLLESKWKNLLDELGDGLKIGICWKSGVVSSERDIHYFPIELWFDVLKISNIHFVNLQYESYEEDLIKIEKRNLFIHNFTQIDLKNDFEELSALISELDLVISPCTVIIELAGALGVNGFMLNNSAEGLWRVQDDGSDIWHPTIQHILPTSIGNKRSVLSKLEVKIKTIVHDFEESNIVN